MRGTNHFYRFADFRFDREKRVLWRGEEMVALPPRASDVLLLLLESDGNLVERREIIDGVWKDTFVEEGNLNQAVTALRRVLGPDLIQTVPRRGYRFTEPITEHIDDRLLIVEKHSTSTTLIEESVDISIKHSPSVSWMKTAVGIAVGVVIIAAAAFIWRSAIDSASVTTMSDVRSVAILPLKEIGSQDESLARGLTDALISRLGRLNRFAVRPYSSVERFGESGKDAITFGQEVKVDAVVEGTIQQADGRIRVNLRLLDSRNGSQLWSDSFDETKTDVLKLQDHVAGRVARAILVNLSPTDEQTIARTPTDNNEAYRMYLAGRERWLRRDWTEDSLAFFRRAIELDPNFALAYVGIADQLVFREDTVPQAEEALNRAIAIDPDLAEAHATAGFLKMFHRFDWRGAEESFHQAIELGPNSSKAHHWYGVYLSMRGRIDEALKEMEIALELDPTALVIKTDIAELHYFRRDYLRAEAELMKVLEIDPTFVNARQNLVKVRYKNGGSYFIEDARFLLFLEQKQRDSGLAAGWDTSELARLCDENDAATLARRSLDANMKRVKSDDQVKYSLARHFAVTGDVKRSLDWLESAVGSGPPGMLTFLGVDPLWDPLRADPRFQAILAKIGLA